MPVGGSQKQGVTASFTERNLLGTGADLVLSAGVTDEWHAENEQLQATRTTSDKSRF